MSRNFTGKRVLGGPVNLAICSAARVISIMWFELLKIFNGRHLAFQQLSTFIEMPKDEIKRSPAEKQWLNHLPKP
jgi:hypothetical protein